VLHEHEGSVNGLITIVGGKLTTHRQLAEDAVDLAFKRLGRTAPKCVTKYLPFPGAVGDLAAVRRQLLGAGLPPTSADRLVGVYGGRALDVVALAAEDPDLLAVVHEPTGAIGAELVFAVRVEFARTLADVLARRTLLAFEPGHALESVDKIAAVLGDRVGWDENRREAEIAGYKRWLDHLAVPIGEPIGEPS
jgi:glycerol-3-phosphate dehydrogenase